MKLSYVSEMDDELPFTRQSVATRQSVQRSSGIARISKYLADASSDTRKSPLHQFDIEDNAEDTDKHKNELEVLTGAYEQSSVACTCKYVLIHPHSKPYQAWETLINIATILNCVINTFNWAFNSTSVISWVIVYSCDLICLVNLILSFFVTHIDKRGIYVTSCGTIACSYMRRLFFWDLLSVLPTDLVIMLPMFSAQSQTWRTVAELRMNRLFGLFRLFRILEERENQLESNAAWWHLCKCLALMILVVHLPTCVWHFLACTGFHEYIVCRCREYTWATKMAYDVDFPKILSDDSAKICNQNVALLSYKSYVLSLYWTITSALTVGYGDIAASNFKEQIVSIITMLLGSMVIYGPLLGGMSALLTSHKDEQFTFTHRIAVIKMHLYGRNIPENVIEEVLLYYQFLFLRKRFQSDEELLDILPEIVKVNFHYTQKQMVFAKAVFANVSLSFKRMLSVYIREQLFLPNQMIVKRGKIGHEMFYIVHGQVEVLEENDDTPLVYFESEKIFAEINLLYSMPVMASVRTTVNCSLYVLDKMDVFFIFEPYREDVKKMKMYIDGQLQAANASVPAQVSSDALDSPLQTTGRPSVTYKLPGIKSRRETVTFREPLSEVAAGPAKKKNVFSSAWTFLSKRTIHPESLAYRIWEACLLVVVVSLTFIYPYMASFCADANAGYFVSSRGHVVLTVTYVMSVMLFVDILVTLRLAIITTHGVKTDFASIRAYYIGTWTFVVDVFAVLPVEWLALAFNADLLEQQKIFSFLLCNRLFKFYRVSLAFDRMEGKLDFALFWKQAVKLFLYTMTLCHLAACLFYTSACFFYSCYDSSWIVRWTNGHNILLNETALGGRYIISLYFGVVTMTSTGFGDITAAETNGFVITIIVEVVGVLTFTYALALLAATIANIDAPRTAFQERLFAVIVFMKNHQLANRLIRRVEQHFTAQWELYRGVWLPGEPSMMNDLPLPMQHKVNSFDVFKIFSQLPMFRKLDDTIINEICDRVIPYVFSPNEVVVYADDPVFEMYVIHKGICQKLTKDGKYVLSEIGPGRFFGSNTMLFKLSYSATVRAKTHCEIYMLKRNDLDEVLAKYEAARKQFDGVIARKDEMVEISKAMHAEVENLITDEKLNEFTLPAFNTDETGKKNIKSLLRRRKVKVDVGLVTFDTKTEPLAGEFDEPYRKLSRIARFVAKINLKYTFLPDGLALKILTFSITAVGVFLGFLTPLHASFFHTVDIAWILAYIADLLVILYMLFVAMHTAYYDVHTSVLVSHPFVTAKYYLRYTFIIDLLCVIPIELIAFMAYGSYEWNDVLHMAAFFRFNRVIHFYRLQRAFSYIGSDLRRNLGTLRFIQFICYILIVTVLVMCILFSCACPPRLSTSRTDLVGVTLHHFCKPNSWIVSRATTPAVDYNITEASMYDLFTRSCYFASVTFVTVGYGDYSAQTHSEMVLLIIIMLIGQVFYTWLMASITASLTNADAARLHFTKKKADAIAYMNFQEVDQKLIRRVAIYYNYLWMRTKGIEPATLFDSLPPALWGEVSLSLYEDIISRISTFKTSEKTFIKEVARRIKPSFFLRGDYIIRYQDIATKIFFIHRGTVEVVSDDGEIVYDTLSTGEAFGELAFHFNITRTTSVRAKDNVDLFALSKADFNDLMSRYPSVRTQMKVEAEVRRKLVYARKRLQSRKSHGLIAVNIVDDPVVPTRSEASTVGSTNRYETPKDSLKATRSESIAMGELDDEPRARTTSDHSQADGQRNDDESPDDVEDVSNGNLGQNELQSEAAISATAPADNSRDLATNTPHSLADVSAVKEHSNERNEKRKVFEWYAVHPDNRAVRLFEEILCLFSVINCCLISYNATFMQFSIVSLIVINSINGLFLIEMLLKLFIAYYDEYGNLIEDLPLVRRHFVGQPTGLVLSILSWFPLSLFVLAVQSSKTHEIIKYLLLIHLVQVVHINSFFKRRSQELNENMMLLRLLSIAVTLIFNLHFIACVWFLISCGYNECTNPTMDYIRNLTMSEATTSWPSIGTVADYCVSLYWAVTIFVSVGYGDILPMSHLEMWYAIIVMMYAKIQIGFIIGEFTSALAARDDERFKFQQKLDVFKNRVGNYNVNKQASTSMIKYYSYLWNRNKGANVRQLFTELPMCLRSEIALAIARPMLEKIPCLIKPNEGFLRMASLYVGQALFQPGEYIMHVNDLADEIFYVKHGMAVFIDKTSSGSIRVLRRLRAGQIFGERGSLLRTTYHASVRANSHVELLTVSWSDLVVVMQQYPDVLKEAHSYALHEFNVDIPELHISNAE